MKKMLRKMFIYKLTWVQKFIKKNNKKYKNLQCHIADCFCGGIQASLLLLGCWSDNGRDPLPAVWTSAWGPPFNTKRALITAAHLNTVSLEKANARIRYALTSGSRQVWGWSGRCGPSYVCLVRSVQAEIFFHPKDVSTRFDKFDIMVLS